MPRRGREAKEREQVQSRFRVDFHGCGEGRGSHAHVGRATAERARTGRPNLCECHQQPKNLSMTPCQSSSSSARSLFWPFLPRTVPSRPLLSPSLVVPDSAPLHYLLNSLSWYTPLACSYQLPLSFGSWCEDTSDELSQSPSFWLCACCCVVQSSVNLTRMLQHQSGQTPDGG